MPFDAKELLENLFPTHRPGQWVPCDSGLPQEFVPVVFVTDDGSAEGMLYMGYREENFFRVMYCETHMDPFPVGGFEGVAFWSPLPDHRSLFDGSPLRY